MKFLLRSFLLLTLIVSFLLETFGSAISFHKCTQTQIVSCETKASENESCCCDKGENITSTKPEEQSSKEALVNFQDVGNDCCKVINSYFNIPVYQVERIFTPDSPKIDLYTNTSLSNKLSFKENISFLVHSDKELYWPPNEHLSVFCVFQI